MREPLDVVIRHDIDVGTELQAVLSDRRESSKGHQVVSGEDGGRPVGSGEQLLGGPDTARLLEVAEGDQCRVDVDSMSWQNIDESVVPLASGGDRLGTPDKGDAAVTGGGKMVDRRDHILMIAFEPLPRAFSAFFSM